MKKGKLILFLIVLILLFTACNKKDSVDHRQDSDPVTESYDNPVEKQTEKQTEQQTKEETRSSIPESGQTGGNNGSASYEEYLNSLQYIDAMEEKLSEAITTVDMVDSCNGILEAWDKELNKIYALLMEKLSAEQKEELKSIQRMWIKERDKAADQSANAFLGGSFAQVAYIDSLCQSTKRRTLELIAVYCNDSNDFSFDVKPDNGMSKESSDVANSKYVIFDVYDVNKKYYAKNGDNYLELDLKLPKLKGNYEGIQAINEYFVNKEPYFFEQLPWEYLEVGDSVTMEGRKSGYFVSADYYLEVQIGDVISIPAVLDGGAGGVSWVGMEGNAFHLSTGEKIELSELFRVSEEEYMNFIYDFVSKEVNKEIKAGDIGYFFEDAYSEIGISSIRAFNQENFIISSNALFVFYDKYDLADGASGVKMFEIPYDAMKDILAENE